jgi:DNA-binding FadR family transcriptional regulator
MTVISKKKLSDSVTEEIKRMISSGELKEGAKLPNQYALAARLGVSRTSLREALNLLTLIGVIEQRPGAGTFIRSRLPAVYASHVTPPLPADEEEGGELIESRRHIEMGASELAAVRATPGEIEEMKTLLDAMSEACDKGRIAEYAEKDLAFHLLIAGASHNRFLSYLLVTLRGVMEQSMRESFTLLPWMVKRSLAFHVKIVRAIESGNPTRAASEMGKHIVDIRKRLKSLRGVKPTGCPDAGST